MSKAMEADVDMVEMAAAAKTTDDMSGDRRERGREEEKDPNANTS